MIAASSITVCDDGHPFVYEYIVPQMILRWLMTQNELDGIRYFSTRFHPNDKNSPSFTATYVFPALSELSQSTGHSERLKDLFELTEPMLWRHNRILISV